MAPPAWPSQLPQTPLADGYSEILPVLAIRTPMQSGPSKSRRVLSNHSTYIWMKMMMTKTQVDIFIEFYRTTIHGGALAFTWIHPRTQEEILCRIVSDENNEVTLQSINSDKVIVSFTLEVLP